MILLSRNQCSGLRLMFFAHQSLSATKRSSCSLSIWAREARLESSGPVPPPAPLASSCPLAIDLSLLSASSFFASGFFPSVSQSRHAGGVIDRQAGSLPAWMAFR